MEKHGMYDSPEHNAWKKMKYRCANPNAKNFHRYGGRGIAVCQRWAASFNNFYADMGPRPSAGHSLDRINNDGNYEPGNCRWATPSQQNRNKSVNVFIEHGGRRMILADWARETGIGIKTLELRVKSGWSASDALTLPVEFRNWSKVESPRPAPTWRRHDAIKREERAKAAKAAQAGL